MEQTGGKTLHYSLVILVMLGCLFLIHQLAPFLSEVWGVVVSILTPFVIAMVISYLLNPIVNLLTMRRVPRGMAVLIIYIVFFAGVSVLLVNTLPVLISQIKDLIETLPSSIQQIEGWFHSVNSGKKKLPLTMQYSIDQNLIGMQSRISGMTSDLVGLLGNMFESIMIASSIPFLVFYMLKDLKVFEKSTVAFFPRSYRPEIIDMLKSIDEALGSYIRGQMLVMLAVGIFTYAGFLVIGLPLSLLFAVIVGVTNIIPYVGPFIGAAPALVYALMISPVLAGKVLLVNVIVQVLEGNVLSPAIVGRSLSLHPLLIILALLIGGEIGGIVGLIVAVPLVAVAKVILEHLFLHFRH